MKFKGEHTEKCTLKKRTVTTNDFNEEIEDWDSNDTTIYAEFYEQQGREGDSDGQVAVIQDVRCKVRYRSGLDPDEGNTPEADYRIQRGQTTYDIESVVKKGRREAMKLMLKRRDNE